MWKNLRLQLPSRFQFALIGLAACLLLAGMLELCFAKVKMQGRLTDQSVRSLLFDLGAAQRSTPEHLRAGDIEITLRWHNRNDLDLWCDDPTGERIYCNHPHSASGGELDLDMNTRDGAFSNQPVEHIRWPWHTAPKGHYRVYVNYFAAYGGPDPTNFEGQIRVEGRTLPFTGAGYAFGERKQLVAEFDVTHDPRGFLGISPAMLSAALVVGVWFGLLAGLLAAALIQAENIWYRRHYQKPILGRSAALRRAGTAAAIAFGYAAVSQLLFGVIASHLSYDAGNQSVLLVVLRLLGWTLCFMVVTARLSRLVPNIPKKSAPLIGLLLGWIAGIGFLVGAPAQAEVAARLFGAGLFGFVVGFLICLLWEEAPTPVKPKATPMLSLPPMRLQPYRMTVNQIERPGHKTLETDAVAAPVKPPLVPHEKPA